MTAKAASIQVRREANKYQGHRVAKQSKWITAGKMVVATVIGVAVLTFLGVAILRANVAGPESTQTGALPGSLIITPLTK